MNTKKIERIATRIRELDQALEAFKKSGKISVPTQPDGVLVSVITMTVTGKESKKVFVSALKQCRKQLKAELRELV